MTLFEWIVVILLGLITLRLLFLESLNYSPGFSQILTELRDINRQMRTINSEGYEEREFRSDISDISNKLFDAVVCLESIDNAFFDVKGDFGNIANSLMEIETKINDIDLNVSIIRNCVQ